MKTTTPSVDVASTPDVVMEDSTVSPLKTISDLVFGTVADLEIGTVLPQGFSFATTMEISTTVASSEELSEDGSQAKETELSFPKLNSDPAFTILPQKDTAPIFTNKASVSHTLPSSSTPPPPHPQNSNPPKATPPCLGSIQTLHQNL